MRKTIRRASSAVTFQRLSDRDFRNAILGAVQEGIGSVIGERQSVYKELLTEVKNSNAAGSC